jgi:type I restriction enzyme, S subunit
MNETLEAIAQALFKSWFVDFDPVRVLSKQMPEKPAFLCAKTLRKTGFPDRFQKSTLGEIPEGWRVANVDEEFRLTMGQSPPGNTYNETGDGIPFYQGRTDFGFRYPTARVFCTVPSRFANTGDSLVSVRAPVGSVNLAAEKCCVGRGVAAVRHKSGSRSYTYYFMRSLESAFEQFEAEGTVFGAINKADFHALERVAPPLAFVEAFENRVFSIDQRIENNEEESRTLAALRDTLLPKLQCHATLYRKHRRRRRAVVARCAEVLDRARA